MKRSSWVTRWSQVQQQMSFRETPRKAQMHGGQRAESGATRQRQGRHPLWPPGGVGPCDTCLSDAGPRGPESLTVCGSGLRPSQGTGPGSPWCWRGWLGSPGSGFWNAPWVLGLRARKESRRKPHPSLSRPPACPDPRGPTVHIHREGREPRVNAPSPSWNAYPQPRSRAVPASTQARGGTFSWASQGCGRQPLEGQAGPQPEEW